MAANILPIDPLRGPTPWKNSKFNFSEHGHFAYQIKGNDKFSKMQAYILSLHVPLTPGVGSKVKTFFF